MNFTLEEYINKELKKLGEYSLDKWVDFQENISNFKYPERKWSSDFKEIIKSLFVEIQEEHEEKVIELFISILIEQYNDLKRENHV